MSAGYLSSIWLPAASAQLAGPALAVAGDGEEDPNLAPGADGGTVSDTVGGAVDGVADGAAEAADSATGAAKEAVDTAVEAVDTTVDLLQLLAAGIVGFFVGVVLMLVVQGVVRYVFRSKRLVREALRPTARPLQLMLGTAGAWIGMGFVLKSNRPDWYGTAEHGVLIAEILALTWLVAAAVSGIEHVILETMRQSSQSRYRKVQTQMQILQRVVTVTIWVCGFAAVLLTYPQARTVGASLLASAGILSVVLGIAAQHTFGNVFAGLQLAFSDSIRVGDVLNWEGQRCNVEEITLTYVVLRVWDGRRLIVPSSKMTTQTFENWTRRSPEILDHVNFRLDWSAPIPRIREYLQEVLAATDLWDGRVGVLQVRDTDAECIQVSALVSAKNSSTMIDLRNYVREEMLARIQRELPGALPHSRFLNYNGDEFERSGLLRDAREVAGEERRGASLSPAGPAAEGKDAGEPGKDGPSRAPVVMPGDGGQAPTLVPKTNEMPADLAGGDRIPARPRMAEGPEGAPMPGDDEQRDLEETTVMTVADIARVDAALSTDQPERKPIAQREAMPVAEAGAPRASATKCSGHASSVFSGSLEAEAREREFESAGATAAADREEAARRKSSRDRELEGRQAKVGGEDGRGGKGRGRGSRQGKSRDSVSQNAQNRDGGGENPDRGSKGEGEAK